MILHTIDCLWGPLGAETLVRVILVADTTRACGYQIALITTDLTSTPTQIIERYADRWAIEVCYRDLSDELPESVHLGRRAWSALVEDRYTISLPIELSVSAVA